MKLQWVKQPSPEGTSFWESKCKRAEIKRNKRVNKWWMCYVDVSGHFSKASCYSFASAKRWCEQEIKNGGTQ
jgi:hypothetical protein